MAPNFHQSAKHIAVITLSALCLFACSRKIDNPQPDDIPDNGNNDPYEQTDLEFDFAVSASDDTDNILANITAYLFDSDGRMYDTCTLTPQNNNVSMSAKRNSEAFFISGAILNAADGISKQDFLKLSIGSDAEHNNTAPEFLSASTRFGNDAATSATDVVFRHRTARIDLDTSSDAGITVSQIVLQDVPKAAFPFTENHAQALPTTSYTKQFAKPASGIVTDLFRVYESATPVEVSILGFYNDSPISISLTIPSLAANKVYTLALRNAGAAIEGRFRVSPWQDGDTITGTPDAGQRIVLDKSRCEIPSGVSVDFDGGIIQVPASGAQMTLAFAADSYIDISQIEGLSPNITTGDPQFSRENNSFISRYAIGIAPQGNGRLGYEVVLHLKNRLLAGSYDYVVIRVAPSDRQIQTVSMAGSVWMSFNARSSDLEDQIYPLDGCSVEDMYRSNWLECIGGLFQFGRKYMYVPWQGYNPSNDLGGQKQDVPWHNDTHMPCPEGYRVPSPAELEALLPSGTIIPGIYKTIYGETITASLLSGDPISTPTNVSGTPYYVKLSSGSNYLIIPLAGWKGDKSTSNNPNFGQRAVLWTNDNQNQPGGWAQTHSILPDAPNNTATMNASNLQMEAFASLRCIKK